MNNFLSRSCPAPMNYIADILATQLIFHLRSTGVVATMYGLQYFLPCMFCSATRTRYCVPLSTVRMCAVVSGSLIITSTFLPLVATTSYCTSQEQIAFSLSTSTVEDWRVKGTEFRWCNIIGQFIINSVSMGLKYALLIHLCVGNS